MNGNRFVNSSLPTLQQTGASPALVDDHTPIPTIEQALESVRHLVPKILDYLTIAKREYKQSSNLLTPDESIAIYLYTMPTPFFSTLNIALRDLNSQIRHRWLPYLRLLMAALNNLPSIKATIWRGVGYDATSNFVDDDIYTWWGITSCSMDISRVQSYLGESGTLFAIETVQGKDVSMLSAVPDEKEVILMPGTRVCARHQPLDIIGRFFVIHLKESASEMDSSLFQQIKQEYRRSSRIERFMNPSKSFPIEQGYINLSIVEYKEQREKEKQLQNAQQAVSVIGVYEDIYAVKTPIDVKDIFKRCNNNKKQVLVFGRAGIGKSIVCRHIAHQWAIGSYWSEYELLALIPLRRLTIHRYPPNKEYSPIDLVKKELFPLPLNKNEEEQLEKQFDAKKTLWILDGYDEIVQSIPEHLKSLLEQLLKTPHHIITSRPYLNTLSYDVQMEIIGFTDENIRNYVHNFFNQMKDEFDATPLQSEKLLKLLRANASIWGVAHIPVNLELICSLWSNVDWSEITQLTVTKLYKTMTEWLCRRYLTTNTVEIQKISAKKVYERCHTELKFIETLAFRAMENETIFMRPALLKKVSKETKIALDDHPGILNMGILKSVDKQGVGSQIAMEKDHYFVHLSFQEYFAARYLINALRESQNEESIKFIRQTKYNQRYTLLFSFMCGLLSDEDENPYLDLFWNAILEPPVDLVGVRHMQLVVACMEEITDISIFCRRSVLLQWIANGLHNSFVMKNKMIRSYLLQSLRRAQSIVSAEEITQTLVDFLQRSDAERKAEALLFIRDLKLDNPSATLITPVTCSLTDKNEKIRMYACNALGSMGERVATNEVIGELVNSLSDENQYVRECVCIALGELGSNVANNEVIHKLVDALKDESVPVRVSARDGLVKICEKGVSSEVSNILFNALEHQGDSVKTYVCEALGKIAEKVEIDGLLTRFLSILRKKNVIVDGKIWDIIDSICKQETPNKYISEMMCTLDDPSATVRRYSCRLLGKLGARRVRNEVILKLLSALKDPDSWVRKCAHEALGQIATIGLKTETIDELTNALKDKSALVRVEVCNILRSSTKETVKTEVIAKLTSGLQDPSEYVRMRACEVLGKMGEKAATTEVISKLTIALHDPSEDVRKQTCKAFTKMGEKAATTEVVGVLLNALTGQSYCVRSCACDALEEIAKKGSKSIITDQLMKASKNESTYVRAVVCRILGNLGEKSATTEMISILTAALQDPDDEVRMRAYEALGTISEKIVTDEMMSKLVDALNDPNKNIRKNACSILKKIIKKRATNEVISKLLTLLEHSNADATQCACEVLGCITEKAVNNEVFSKLAMTVENNSVSIKAVACEALGNLCGTTVTDEVIRTLVSAQTDKSDEVATNALIALRKIGQPVETKVIVSKLLSTVKHRDKRIRSHAYETLEKIGEQVVTDEIMVILVNGLRDEDEEVRKSVLDALRKIGRTGSTNGMFDKLWSVLEHPSELVRIHACEAVEVLCAGTVTNAVISKLIANLEDKSERVRNSASMVLKKISKRIIIKEVMPQLISVANGGYLGFYEYPEIWLEMLGSFPTIKQLNPRYIAGRFLCDQTLYRFMNVSESDLVKVLLETEDLEWLPAVTRLTLLKGTALIVREDTVTVYDNKEPLEIASKNSECSKQLVEALTKQAKELCLYREIS